jgi:hypothetical protein
MDWFEAGTLLQQTGLLLRPPPRIEKRNLRITNAAMMKMTRTMMGTRVRRVLMPGKAYPIS